MAEKYSGDEEIKLTSGQHVHGRGWKEGSFMGECREGRGRSGRGPDSQELRTGGERRVEQTGRADGIWSKRRRGDQLSSPEVQLPW